MLPSSRLDGANCYVDVKRYSNPAETSMTEIQNRTSAWGTIPSKYTFKFLWYRSPGTGTPP